ncbi:VOC family protein [Streptomyces sp. C11-1]|uniref:VOC family protein n=1 Tax=Streptomyces durocortorensis TaxID=2811104 RepID=A0ABY9VRC1_9ACTN|nr:VOC family protein [Streptomyces durocortorensis]WNF25417.1 VOC family protein [Streptomyces durocortorensis]
MTAAEQTTPVHGVPCWVSLMTPDLRATEDFYTAVLGWTFRSGTLGKGFSVAHVGTVPVAGIGQIAPGLPASVNWTPYFAVDDVDAAAGRVRERGGTIAVGPIRLGPGRGAVAADREGAGFGFWEGRTPPWLLGRDNAPASLELRTSHAFDAAIFYAEIFGWASEEPGGCEVGYAYAQDAVVVRQGGRTVATLRGGGDGASPDPRLRPRWHVRFLVEDLEAVTEAARRAGGAVSPPVDRPADGTESVISDPYGGIFTVCTHLAPDAPGPSA